MSSRGLFVSEPYQRPLRIIDVYKNDNEPLTMNSRSRLRRRGSVTVRFQRTQLLSAREVLEEFVMSTAGQCQTADEHKNQLQRDIDALAC